MGQQGLEVQGPWHQGAEPFHIGKQCHLEQLGLSLPLLIFPGKEDLGSGRRIPADKAHQDMANFRPLRCLGWTGITLSEAAGQATMKAGAGQGCLIARLPITGDQGHKQQPSVFSK